MKDPAPRHLTVTRWRTLALVALAAAVLAGCDLATGTVRTATELQRAGIHNPNLNYDGGTATLDYDADPNPLDARAEQDRAAEIIWRNLPFRIEEIVITSDSGAFPNRRVYPREELEQRLGPRPANLDRSVQDIARRATVIAGVVALVVLVLIVLVIVLVVRAVRRRPPAPAGPQPWGQQGWGQPGQPGWTQPGQPGQQQGWGPPAPPPGQPVPPAGQQPWGSQPGYGQPPSPAWPAPPAPQQPPSPHPPPSSPDDWPSGAPRPEGEPPPRGPGDTQRLDPEPPPGEERGPTPPVPPA